MKDLFLVGPLMVLCAIALSVSSLVLVATNTIDTDTTFVAVNVALLTVLLTMIAVGFDKAFDMTPLTEKLKTAIQKQ